MSDLLALYHYLVMNQPGRSEDHPYCVALRALEPVIAFVLRLERWGRTIRDRDGMSRQDANTITQDVIEMHKDGLCRMHDDDVTATLVDFVKSHVPLGSRDALIAALQQDQKDHP